MALWKHLPWRRREAPKSENCSENIKASAFEIFKLKKKGLRIGLHLLKTKVSGICLLQRRTGVVLSYPVNYVLLLNKREQDKLKGLNTAEEDSNSQGEAD